MIRHLFTIIWNERRSNAWILLEYTVVFCVLWFCCDYIFSALRTYMREEGIDIRHTYIIDMRIRPDFHPADSAAQSDPYACVQTFTERVERYPGVEAVSFGNCAFPYLGCYSSGGFIINSDSSGTDMPRYQLQLAQVSPGFFDVFRIGLRKGNGFNRTDADTRQQIIITPFDRKGERFGHFPRSIAIDSVETILTDHAGARAIPVVGVAEKAVKEINAWRSPQSLAYVSLQREEYDLARNQIAVRVSPETDRDFPERFVREMRDQLNIGPYYLATVSPMQTRLQENLDELYLGDGQMNGTYAVMGFLIANVFLGILGSFWFRIQARRSEIGLRIALGSSKRNVRGLIVGETLLLLALAGTVGTIVCFNLSAMNFSEALGIPTIDRNEWGIGTEQDLLNVLLVFGFLALTSIAAVLYPARKASEIPPAEVLRDE